MTPTTHDDAEKKQRDREERDRLREEFPLGCEIVLSEIGKKNFPRFTQRMIVDGHGYDGIWLRVKRGSQNTESYHKENFKRML